jgi:hypothetical protein
LKIDTLTWFEIASKAIDDTIKHCYKTTLKGNWQENHITSRLLENLPHYDEPLHWTDINKFTHWDAYKLTSTAEQQNGDIAVIVRVWFSQTEYFDGVAFYEAKRQFFEQGQPDGFKSLDVSQLGRISTHTPASYVLLYDINTNTSNTWASAIPTPYFSAFHTKTITGHSGRTLHSHARNWAEPLLQNLIGFNLDPRSEKSEDIKKWVEKLGFPSFIISASVWTDPNMKPEPPYNPGDGYSKILYKPLPPAPMPRTRKPSGGFDEPHR